MSRAIQETTLDLESPEWCYSCNRETRYPLRIVTITPEGVWPFLTGTVCVFCCPLHTPEEKSS